MPEYRIDYLSPTQEQFLRAKTRYVGFGGARGGGKSFVVDVAAVLFCLKYSGMVCMIVRKTYPELRENHIVPLTRQLQCYHADRRQRMAAYNDSQKVITFPNGSRILFRYCDTDKDAERFQGTQCDVLFVDEGTHQSEERFKKLTACVRGVNDYPKRVYVTCNPGGVGHEWVKRLFIDRKYRAGENADDYMFIQSKVTDNKPLMDADPDYKKQLEALPPKLRRAWLDGDWDIFEGAFFEEFRAEPDRELCDKAGISAEDALKQRKYTHVIPAFDLNEGGARGWTIYRSYDFGYSKPFSCAWWAIDYDGVMYRILELYGCTDTPNEGVKWTPDEQFKRIAETEQTHPWLKGRKIFGVADPSIWDTSRGISIAETAEKYGIYFDPGDNKRIAGWMQCHYRLQFDANGYARCYIFDNCKAFIRTIPLLMYDEHNPEDLDTSMEDHCLTGDTMVLTDDGYRPIASLVGTNGAVLSHDGQYHRYGDVRLTRTNTPVLKITLEDGTIIKCTDDHRLMLSNGEWKTAGELVAGEEVMTVECTENKRNNTEI